MCTGREAQRSTVRVLCPQPPGDGLGSHPFRRLISAGRSSRSLDGTPLPTPRWRHRGACRHYTGLAVFHAVRSGDPLDPELAEVLLRETNQGIAASLIGFFELRADPRIECEHGAGEPPKSPVVEETQGDATDISTGQKRVSAAESSARLTIARATGIFVVSVAGAVGTAMSCVSTGPYRGRSVTRSAAGYSLSSGSLVSYRL